MSKSVIFSPLLQPATGLEFRSALEQKIILFYISAKNTHFTRNVKISFETLVQAGTSLNLGWYGTWGHLHRSKCRNKKFGQNETLFKTLIKTQRSHSNIRIQASAAAPTTRERFSTSVEEQDTVSYSFEALVSELLPKKTIKPIVD